ncbi:MAG: carboxymuconolactone decarboxylase family protein [Desulfovibrionaceae bacterium]
MERQTQLHDAIAKDWDRYRALAPEINEGYDEMARAAYSPGRFDAKTKRIMAVVASVVHGCRACMLFQTRRALELGASAEEILEACGVAVALGGSMASGELTRVVRFLDEQGAL